jgi:hypothetical protein
MAHTIAEFIEVICLIDAATPYAYHILITVDEQLEPGTIAFSSHSIDARSGQLPGVAMQ